MSYILNSGSTLGRRRFCYDYQHIINYNEVNKFVAWIDRASAKICKAMTQESNSEWIFRIYMAARMILSATLAAQSVVFSMRHNLRIAIPHLQYNALQYCCRALLCVNPLQNYHSADFFEKKHTKIINESADIISRFCPDLSRQIKSIFACLKDNRDIITYRGPSSGDSILDQCDVNSFMMVICELAQLQSELFEQSYTKHVKERFKLDLSKAPKWLFKYQYCEGDERIDNEDWYRINYIRRKFPRPVSIRLFMTEGWVEDFFGAWVPKDEDSKWTQFDPDEDWKILFNVP